MLETDGQSAPRWTRLSLVSIAKNNETWNKQRGKEKEKKNQDSQKT